MQLINLGRLAVLFLSLVFVNQTALAEQTKLVGFDAEYTVNRFGRSLGLAKLSLSTENENYRLNYYSKVSAFFLSDIRSETSLFSVNEDQSLQPISYAYSRSGTGRNKSLKLDFDATNTAIIINQGEPINWQGELDNQLYRLDVQLRLAAGDTELSYNIINSRGQLRNYNLEVVGTEQLDLPFGMIEGVKVVFKRETSTRETIAWFSPQLNYQLVKLQQFKDGKEQGDIQLKRFSSEALASQ
ncbi:DUF3108 domain-containing protein [Paraglaciecola sp. 2405UD69-4]|uniref:DUF3108 domain-containing protein n=1 Tax=Paraglaciecola sp. 2405UD69-4 TaxID=3391836 RepID=UPI0039C9B096